MTTMVSSADFIEQTGDDAARLEALRRFGRSLPNAGLYERHADTMLAALRSRVERHANGCWTWKGEPYETVGQKRMKIDPRLLIWVACAEAEPGHDLTLWPTCSLKECLRPEHQIEVVSLSSAVVRLTMWSDEGNEQFVRAALSKGDLRRVESPHFPRAMAFLPGEWEQWLKRPDLEDYLLSLMPLVPLAWQPEIYQRRLRAIRGEDAAQIERMLLFSAHMGLGNVSREAATRGLAEFWKHIRFRNNLSYSACWWWWREKDQGAPLYIGEQGDPHLLVDPAQLSWTLMTGALPPSPPGQIRRYCDSPSCVNPDHRSEVVLVSDAALLFPASLDETIRRAGVALFERAVREKRLSSFIVGEEWAVKWQDCLEWVRSEGEQHMRALLLEHARDERSPGLVLAVKAPAGSRGRPAEAGSRTSEASGGELVVDDLPRLYFSTDSRLYELPYRREEIGYQEGRLRDEPLYHLEYPWPLKELPFNGSSWLNVVSDLGEEGGRATYFHLPAAYDPAGRLGNFSRVTHGLEPSDVQCVVILRPSHTTPAIAALMADEWELWHISALNRQWFEGGPPPPEPSDEIQHDEQGNVLYDVFARGRHVSAVTLAIRLPFDEALEFGVTAALQEQGILLRYHEPEDSLVWIRSGLPGELTAPGGKPAEGRERRCQCR